VETVRCGAVGRVPFDAARDHSRLAQTRGPINNLYGKYDSHQSPNHQTETDVDAAPPPPQISLAALNAVSAVLRAAPRIAEPCLDKLMPLLFLKLCAPKDAMRGAAEASLQGAARWGWWLLLGLVAADADAAAAGCLGSI